MLADFVLARPRRLFCEKYLTLPLFVDGNKMDTMEFTLDAAEWKALPGTVLPSSNVTNGTTSNNDKLDNVPQTGDTSSLALWIALLFVSSGAAIGTTVVSRKKKYNR